MFTCCKGIKAQLMPVVPAGPVTPVGGPSRAVLLGYPSQEAASSSGSIRVSCAAAMPGTRRSAATPRTARSLFQSSPATRGHGRRGTSGSSGGSPISAHI
jgi:hypothetical protein